MRTAPPLAALALALGAALFAPGGAAAQDRSAPQQPAPAATPGPRQLQPGARPAARPPLDAGQSRGFLSFGAGAQLGSQGFSETRNETLYAETFTWTADYSVETGLAFEVGAGWRVWRALFLGATYSRFHDSRRAAVTGSVPHPFFFNQPRQISGESAALAHDEDGVHVSAYWIVPAARRLEISVFGGPSIIAVSRDLIRAVEYTEEYPYDEATFSVAPAGDARKTGFGAHGGVDVTWLVNPQVGVGGTLRYSRATVDLPTPVGGSAAVDAGGLQAVFSVKFRFPAKTAARRGPGMLPAPPPTGAPKVPPPPGVVPAVVTIEATPVFLRADATLTPLRQLPAGMRLRVLGQSADWVHVEFDDSRFGRRVGYVQRTMVRDAR